MILGQFFLGPPDEDAIEALRQDFGLDFRESAEEISGEFDRLFLFPGGSLVPLESIFTPADALIRPDVERSYASAHLAVDDTYGMPSDHLAVEFLFMGYLIERGDPETVRKFLEQHLMNWVPYYCDEILKQAKTIFYREIATMVKDFLRAEYEEYAG